MGILNVTPDSFFDGGRYLLEIEILKHVEKMLGDGAWCIDLGGYSSRPRAEDISIEEEQRRILFAIRLILKNFPDAWISIDTFRSEVAKSALDEGAIMVNDISGGSLDPQMYSVVAKYKVPYVIMHMRGTPQSMSELTDYENLVKEVIDYFHQKLFKLQEHGIYDVIIDPGFGFAKTIDQNFQLLNKLEALKVLGKPILTGLSRKSMIWKTLNISPQEAINGTASLNTLALLKGVNFLRVHDVKETMQVIQLVEKTTLS
jgi:dihydropteroate synthase